MNLDHVTLPADDYAASLAFYLALGLHKIVAAPPRYARSEMEGGATLSFEVGGTAGSAEIHPNCLDLGANQRFPPWRIDGRTA